MPTPTIFSKWKENQHDGNAINFDVAGDTIQVLLLKSTYTIDQTDEFVSDLTPASNEVSGTGYARKTVANQSVALDGTTVEITHDDVTWAQNASGFTNARYAVWFRNTGADATSPIVMILDFGADKGIVDGNLTLDVNPATGVINV
jgi:hypothetical protein